MAYFAREPESDEAKAVRAAQQRDYLLTELQHARDEIADMGRRLAVAMFAVVEPRHPRLRSAQKALEAHRRENAELRAALEDTRDLARRQRETILALIAASRARHEACSAERRRVLPCASCDAVDMASALVERD